MLVKLLKSIGNYNEGEQVNFGDEVAKSLVEQGAAEVVEEVPTKPVKKKTDE